MCNNVLGKKDWIIPDCELPMPGEGKAQGHESVIIVNDSDVEAEIDVSLYFVDRDPHTGIKWKVAPKRVFCFRMNIPEHMGGFVVPFETQYAMKVSSNTPIVLQYGRLDNTQANLAFYTTLGYSE
ncbi:MAG: hypothetical protein IJ939_05125 [Clostridia bacterium]|nr:hypothetical protein [Clostridia bacterium]